MRVAFELSSYQRLASFLMLHYRAEIEARFPSGEGDVALFAVELIERLRKGGGANVKA